MQKRILKAGPLHDGNGHLVETGYATELIKTYNRSKVAAKRWRIKEWDYYAICTDKFALALTIDHNPNFNISSGFLAENFAAGIHQQKNTSGIA